MTSGAPRLSVSAVWRASDATSGDSLPSSRLFRRFCIFRLRIHSEGE